MKTFIFATILVLLTSFSPSQRQTPWLRVYSSGLTQKQPSYLIFRDASKSYEFYIPSGQTSIFGTWKTRKDSLFLYPKYISFSDRIREIEEDDRDSSTVDQELLIKGDSIIDVTDYANHPQLQSFVDTLKHYGIYDEKSWFNVKLKYVLIK